MRGDGFGFLRRELRWIDFAKQGAMPLWRPAFKDRALNAEGTDGDERPRLVNHCATLTVRCAIHDREHHAVARLQVIASLDLARLLVGEGKNAHRFRQLA